MRWEWGWQTVVRKVTVAVAGFAVLAVGLVLIVLPGPAVLVIPLGLTILGKEFRWARELLEWLKTAARRASTQLAQVLARLSAVPAVRPFVALGKNAWRRTPALPANGAPLVQPVGSTSRSAS